MDSGTSQGVATCGFYKPGPDEQSEILLKRGLKVGEAIEELTSTVEQEEEDDLGSSPVHRELLQSEREFLLAFASQNFNAQARRKEEVDDFATDLISVLNHFFEYGFQQKDTGSTYDTSESSKQSSSDLRELAGGQEDEAYEVLTPLRPKSRQITHYWDLITKYFPSEYPSVSYVNHHLDEHSGESDEVSEQETMQEEKQRKALTWLIIALNEDQLLYYCFHSIF